MRLHAHHTDVTAKREHRSAAAGGRRAHACTEIAARKRLAETSGLCVTRLLPRPFKARLPASARAPPRGAAARRNRGVRGELFPPHAFRGPGGDYLPRRGSGRSPALLPVPFLSILSFLSFLHRRSLSFERVEAARQVPLLPAGRPFGGSDYGGKSGSYSLVLGYLMAA